MFIVILVFVVNTEERCLSKNLSGEKDSGGKIKEIFTIFTKISPSWVSGVHVSTRCLTESSRVLLMGIICVALEKMAATSSLVVLGSRTVSAATVMGLQ